MTDATRLNSISHQLRCLPSFHMLGPFHTGVGDLYRRVAAHPDVMTSAPAQLHFWAEERPAEALFRAYAPAAASIARTAALVRGSFTPDAPSSLCECDLALGGVSPYSLLGSRLCLSLLSLDAIGVLGMRGELGYSSRDRLLVKA